LLVLSLTTVVEQAVTIEIEKIPRGKTTTKQDNIRDDKVLLILNKVW
jgi:hypothetical protein